MYDFRRDASSYCGANCSEIIDARGQYSTTLFAEEAVRIIRDHPSSHPEQPLFLYLAFQGVHSPAMVPIKYEKPYEETITEPHRRTFAGMLACVDEGLANITTTLNVTGMLESTLTVVTTDNGGPTTTSDSAGARNWPLRGGKHSLWDGGVRGTGLLAGVGILRAGVSFSHLMHGSDWLPTLAAAAGIPIISKLPLDGVSQWPALSSPPTKTGASWPAAARTFAVLGNSTNNCKWPKGDPRAERPRRHAQFDGPDDPGCGFAILKWEEDAHWKFIRGYGGGPDNWCNSTANKSEPVCDNHVVPPAGANESSSACSGIVGSDGHCLFELTSDPFERSELTGVPMQYDGIVTKMQAAVDLALTTYTQYEIDPSCGPATFANDSEVGTTAQPWCG